MNDLEKIVEGVKTPLVEGDTKIATPLEFINGLLTNVYIQRILISILIFVVINLLRLLVFKILHARYQKNLKKYYRLKKISSRIIITIGVIIIGSIWFVFFDQILTFLGLLSAGIAIALREPVTSLAGWLFIIWRKPFEVGDRIQIGETSGDVIDIKMFQSTLIEIGNWVEADQSTGRIIMVPNGKIFTQEVSNYTKGFNFIWNEIPVTVTYESNWKKAKKILTEIVNKETKDITIEAEKRLKEASKKYMIFYSKLTPIVYTKVIDIGIMLTIRYMCNPHTRRTTENNLWENILDQFNKTKDIDFAYPTQRFFLNTKEGKIQTDKTKIQTDETKRSDTNLPPENTP